MGKTDGILLPMDASWVLTCATLVFLMQLGFAQLEAGLVQTKNVIATYMKNLIDFVLGALSALFFGCAPSRLEVETAAACSVCCSLPLPLT